MMRVFRPDCVVFNTIDDQRNQEVARELRAHGTAVVLLPTEGWGTQEWLALLAANPNSHLQTDLHLAWSDPVARGIRERWGFEEWQVPAVGCTRIDFYTPAFRPAITSREAFCRGIGFDPKKPLVTWATNYAYADLVANATARQKFLGEIRNNSFAQYHRIIGLDPASVPHLHFEGRHATAAAFIKLASARPEMQFLIRPHPAERRSYYRELMSKHALTNVRFCPQDYIWNVLNASDVHLHRHCTTSVEAWMLDKPTIEMGMDEVPVFAWPDHEEGSETVRGADELIALVDRYAKGAAIAEERRAYRAGYIEKWFGALDGKRCRAAAHAIDALLARRGPRKWRTRNARLATRRQVVTSLLRYALDLRPNRSLRNLFTTAKDDPLDRLITRADVHRYTRLIRDCVRMAGQEPAPLRRSMKAARAKARSSSSSISTPETQEMGSRR